MKKITIVVHDEVFCTLSGLLPTDLNVLRQKFSPYMEGYRFTTKFKIGTWDGKKHFIEKTGRTYVRLLEFILPEIEYLGYELDLQDNRKLVVYPTERVSKDLFGHILLKEIPFELRDYQVKAINNALDNPFSFTVSATSSGKTSMTAGISQIYSKHGHRTVTVVPSEDLCNQTYDFYKMLQMDVGIYCGDKKDLDHGNIVATWQALQYNLSLLETFDVVIWDEAHGCKGDIAMKILTTYGSHLISIIGVTGTLPKGESDRMAVHAAVGPVVTEIPASLLMELGYITPVEIQPVEIHENLTENFIDYDAETAFINKSPDRLEKIADLIISISAKHGNTLVLVNSIPFGKKLAALIKDAVFLYGDDKSEVRKMYYDKFETENNLVVIATAGIASTGISIDRIFCLITVDAKKSFIKAIQSIGRALRKADGKTCAYVYDIYSKLKWAKKHFGDRKKYYEEAQYPVLKTISVKLGKK